MTGGHGRRLVLACVHARSDGCVPVLGLRPVLLFRPGGPRRPRGDRTNLRQLPAEATAAHPTWPAPVGGSRNPRTCSTNWPNPWRHQPVFQISHRYAQCRGQLARYRYAGNPVATSHCAHAAAPRPSRPQTGAGWENLFDLEQLRISQFVPTFWLAGDAVAGWGKHLMGLVPVLWIGLPLTDMRRAIYVDHAPRGRWLIESRADAVSRHAASALRSARVRDGLAAGH